MEALQDFTDTIAWSGSSRAWIQCQQKSACGKSHTTTLTAQRIIHDHMVYHKLESSNLTIMAKLLSHV